MENSLLKTVSVEVTSIARGSYGPPGSFHPHQPPDSRFTLLLMVYKYGIIFLIALFLRSLFVGTHVKIQTLGSTFYPSVVQYSLTPKPPEKCLLLVLDPSLASSCVDWCSRGSWPCGPDCTQGPDPPKVPCRPHVSASVGWSLCHHPPFRTYWRSCPTYRSTTDLQPCVWLQFWWSA